MGSAHSYTTKQNQSRLSAVSSGSKVSTYTNKLNAARISTATTASQATTYTNKVNSSRLGNIDASAFVRNASLLSRLGGDAEVDSLLRIFYGKALRDPLINRLFDTPDAVTQEARIAAQSAFLKAVLGGVRDGSVDVDGALSYIASLGINDEKFAAFIDAVTATLRGQNVPPTVISEVEVFCANMRKKVVV